MLFFGKNKKKQIAKRNKYIFQSKREWKRDT